MLQRKVVEKVKTHFLCLMTFFITTCHLWNNVEKYFTDRQTTDNNIAHAYCMLDTWCYKDTSGICNTYCFSTAKIVARTRLSVGLYISLVVFLRPCVQQFEDCRESKLYTSFRTSQRTNSVYSTENNCLMLFKEKNLMLWRDP